MKVYGHPMSTCTRKVLMTLAEKGHQAELVTVDIMKGEHKQPAHLARQPFGVIPALEDEDFTMYESRAIIRYLDERLGGTKLTPADIRDKARMEQWISIEHSYFTPQAMKILYNLFFGKMAGKEPDMAVVDAAKIEVGKVLDIADKNFEKQDFLAGKTFSLADISWMPYVQYLFAANVGNLITDRKNVKAWWERVSNRPTWKKIAG